MVGNTLGVNQNTLESSQKYITHQISQLILCSLLDQHFLKNRMLEAVESVVESIAIVIQTLYLSGQPILKINKQNQAT